MHIFIDFKHNSVKADEKSAQSFWEAVIRPTDILRPLVDRLERCIEEKGDALAPGDITAIFQSIGVSTLPCLDNLARANQLLEKVISVTEKSSGTKGTEGGKGLKKPLNIKGTIYIYIFKKKNISFNSHIN